VYLISVILGILSNYVEKLMVVDILKFKKNQSKWFRQKPLKIEYNYFKGEVIINKNRRKIKDLIKELKKTSFKNYNRSIFSKSLRRMKLKFSLYILLEKEEQPGVALDFEVCFKTLLDN
jgi:hypothetical protein